MGKVIIGYEKASSEIMTVIDKVMLLHHKPLVDAGVTLQVLLVHKYDANDELVPAMLVRGHVALAKTSITSHQDRARGIADAKLTIDAEYGWSRLPEAGREALVDGELTGIQLITEDEVESEVTVTRVKLDDCGRPKLKLIPPDIRIVGRAAMLERYGEASMETKQIRHFQQSTGQYALFQMPGTKQVKVSK